MNLTATCEIDAPIADVWAEMTRFHRFVAEARNAGATVRRTDRMEGKGVGMGWEADFVIRETPRRLVVEVTEMTAPERLVLDGRIGDMDGQLQMAATALSPDRTAFAVTLDLAPRSLRTRLMMQSIRLARGRIQDRMDRQLRRFARRVETAPVAA